MCLGSELACNHGLLLPVILESRPDWEAASKAAGFCVALSESSAAEGLPIAMQVPFPTLGQISRLASHFFHLPLSNSETILTLSIISYEQQQSIIVTPHTNH
jgi:hypothetical protein